VLASIAVQFATIVIGATVTAVHLNPALPVLLIGLGLTMALSGFFCWRMYRGKNWARYFFVALVAWDISVRLGGATVGAWQLYLNYFLVTASVGAAVLLFLPASRLWFS